ncbi:MAG: M20/M25/M40 family metallo-hydrolase [Herpetosiphonaceae bacterium]|nr:M20/M25/M40 family metallo-hydrolase [Herpetosiphonaceae bacterium]
MTTWFETVRDLTIQLVRWPSVTNSPGERDWSQQLYDLLAQTAYFAGHPEHLRLQRTSADRYERSNLYACVRGAGPATVVLAGHYDVVSIENYGNLAPWATEPLELLPRLIAELSANATSDSDQLALHDLQSGDYLPGRGALDMKSGLAAGLAVLLKFAAQPERQGNLLFIATPDEEDSSHGARSAALDLPGLAQEWGLDLRAAINLDASSDHGSGADGQAIFLGTVGKFLPSVYVVGRDTHAGYPFDGINANLLAAAITQRIECNVALCDEVEGEIAPPPVSLKQADLKPQYDVTTPARAWCYFNYLTHGRPAAEVLACFTAEVGAALQTALSAYDRQAQSYAARSGPSVRPAWVTHVHTFAELHERALAQGGGACHAALSDLTAQLMQDHTLDTPTFSREIIELLWRYSGWSGPAAVVAFGSLHYPHSLVDPSRPQHARLQAAAHRQAAALAAERNTSLRVRPFFTGISDMSFFGSAMAPADQAVVQANTPLWGSRLQFDYAAVRALDLPIVNIGPWGRDYHQRSERIFMPYSFEVVPELIWRVAQDVLDGG